MGNSLRVEDVLVLYFPTGRKAGTYSDNAMGKELAKARALTLGDGAFIRRERREQQVYEGEVVSEIVTEFHRIGTVYSIFGEPRPRFCDR